MTPRQAAFVREYQVDNNGTQAAIRAKYSKKGASVQASTLLGNPKIQAEIQRRREKREERVNIDVDAVVEKLYAASLKFLDTDEPATLNAGINAAARLAKMQGWDAPEKQERGRPGEFDSLTAEERRAKIVELTERIKKPAEKEN